MVINTWLLLELHFVVQKLFEGKGEYRGSGCC